MKETFVLDENVFIQSHTCQDIRTAEDDFSSIGLVYEILSRCHKIGVSAELHKKYYEKTKTLEERGRIDHNCLRMWKQLLIRSDKLRYCTSQLNNLPADVLHDRHVVEPALFLPAILVTTDDDLAEKVTSWALINHQNVRVMSPQQAIAFLNSLPT